MRFGTDIKESVVSALIKHHNKDFLLCTISLFKARGVQLTLVPIEGEPAQVQLGLLQSIVQQLIAHKDKVSLHELLGSLGHMTLVVDEANLAFNENKVKDWMQAQMDLQAFVAMTKQNRQVSPSLFIVVRAPPTDRIGSRSTSCWSPMIMLSLSACVKQ